MSSKILWRIIISLLLNYHLLTIIGTSKAKDDNDSDLMILPEFDRTYFIYDRKQVERMKMEKLSEGSGNPAPLIFNSDLTTDRSAILISTTTKNKTEADTILGLIIGIVILGVIVVVGGFIIALVLIIKYVKAPLKVSKIMPIPQSLPNNVSSQNKFKNLSNTNKSKNLSNTNKFNKASNTNKFKNVSNTNKFNNVKFNNASNSTRFYVKNKMTDVSV